MQLTQKLRFEIFKRDGFVCRYCGKKPPEVTLEIDHVIPKSSGGKDDLNNLVTSCFNCNRGKGKTPLDILPTTVTENLQIIKEQQKQTKAYYRLIEEVEQKKERDLREIGHYYFNLFAKTKRTHNQYIFAGPYKSSMKTFLKTFTKYEIIDAMDIAFGKLGYRGAPDNHRHQVFKYICGILHNWRRDKYGTDTVS